jgi:hypothetical protein
VKISDPHRRYHDFLDYGDAEGYRARLDDFRQRLREGPDGGPADPEKRPEAPARP